MAAFARASWSVQADEREGHLQDLMTAQVGQATQPRVWGTTHSSGISAGRWRARRRRSRRRRRFGTPAPAPGAGAPGMGMWLCVHGVTLREQHEALPWHRLRHAARVRDAVFRARWVSGTRGLARLPAGDPASPWSWPSCAHGLARRDDEGHRARLPLAVERRGSRRRALWSSGTGPCVAQPSTSRCPPPSRTRVAGTASSLLAAAASTALRGAGSWTSRPLRDWTTTLAVRGGRLLAEVAVRSSPLM